MASASIGLLSSLCGIEGTVGEGCWGRGGGVAGVGWFLWRPPMMFLFLHFGAEHVFSVYPECGRHFRVGLGGRGFRVGWGG